MMSRLPQLDRLLKSQSATRCRTDLSALLAHAECLSRIENVVAVVSDLAAGTSRIFPGRFGAVLGLKDYKAENSIWERAIIDLMTEEAREEKYLAELRFFHYVRRMPRRLRPDYHMMSKLVLSAPGLGPVEVTHRMYYIYQPDSDSVSHSLCLYGRRLFDFVGNSLAINSVTGVTEELTAFGDSAILSRRESQVLRLVAAGRTSEDIAGILSISRNTVSRHRQSILSKLQVCNSAQACRTAKLLGII